LQLILVDKKNHFTTISPSFQQQDATISSFAVLLAGPMPSRQTRERPNLCRLLCSFAQKELPGFHFTSIQVRHLSHLGHEHNATSLIPKNWRVK